MAQLFKGTQETLGQKGKTIEQKRKEAIAHAKHNILLAEQQRLYDETTVRYQETKESLSRRTEMMEAEIKGMMSSPKDLLPKGKNVPVYQISDVMSMNSWRFDQLLDKHITDQLDGRPPIYNQQAFQDNRVGHYKRLILEIRSLHSGGIRDYGHRIHEMNQLAELLEILPLFSSKGKQ